MVISHSRATRFAQVVSLLALVAGATLLVRDARLSSHTPEQNSDITSIKSSTEKKITEKGSESTERRETNSGPNPNLTERVLGRSGLWIARIILVLLVAFLAGALVQRAFLGKFALKAGGLELPEVQAPALSLPGSLAREVQNAITSRGFIKSLSESAEMSDVHDNALETITGGGPIEYMEIDLGVGDSWLTTRLFVLAILLRRMRAVKTFVFLETRAGLERRYLGLCNADAVRWLLAHHYPWLERAFAQAYALFPELQILSEWGALEPTVIGVLTQAFIQAPDIQSHEPGSDRENWVELSGRWEHARWLNGTTATDLFNLSPNTTSCIDFGADRRDESMFAQLSAEGSFVALVDARRRFLKLLDREGLLENLAATVRLKYAVSLAFGREEQTGHEVPSGAKNHE